MQTSVHCNLHCSVAQPPLSTVWNLQELDEMEGQIAACLQDSRDMLMNSQCKDEVHRVMVRASEDIRFNQMLADTCLNDRDKFCSTTQQVGSCKPAVEVLAELFRQSENAHGTTCPPHSQISWLAEQQAARLALLQNMSRLVFKGIFSCTGKIVRHVFKGILSYTGRSVAHRDVAALESFYSEHAHNNEVYRHLAAFVLT